MNVTLNPDLRPSEDGPLGPFSSATIPVNLDASADRLVLEAELPAVVGPVEVEIGPDVVRLRARRRESVEELVPEVPEELRALIRERPSGPMERSIHLPMTVSGRPLARRYEDGIYRLELRPSPSATRPSMSFQQRLSRQVRSLEIDPVRRPRRSIPRDACLRASDLWLSPRGWWALVDLPGVPAADLRIRLTIDGHIELSTRQPKADGRTIIHQEFETTSFSRDFEVPEGHDIVRMKARHRDGVLTLSVPGLGCPPAPF